MDSFFAAAAEFVLNTVTWGFSLCKAKFYNAFIFFYQFWIMAYIAVSVKTAATVALKERKVGRQA